MLIAMFNIPDIFNFTAVVNKKKKIHENRMEFHQNQFIVLGIDGHNFYFYLPRDVYPYVKISPGNLKLRDKCATQPEIQWRRVTYFS